MGGGGEQTWGAAGAHDQKWELTSKYLPFGVHLRADGLRQADNNAAGERTPKAPEAAGDHRFECVDQPGWTNGRIEIGADAKIERGNRRHYHRDAHCDRVDSTVVDAHQLCDLEIV